METKSYLFRTADPALPADASALLGNVLAAVTELTVEGHRIEMMPAAATVADDRDGPMVIMPIKAPAGWYHHVQPLLARHGLNCRDYW
jgi:hypothetical protein